MPDATDIIESARTVFAGIERPAHFTNHTHCCECAEHDEELQPFTPDDLTLEALGNMGWDPITFCTDQAFRYLLPGLIRIVLTEDGEENYYEQFLWHVTPQGEYNRHAACSTEERIVVAQALAWLLENRSAEIEREMCSTELLYALETWTERDP